MIVHLLLALISFITITKIFLDKFSVWVSTCFILFISGFFAIKHYVTVSFSFLPSLLTIAGLLCIIHYSKKEKWILGTVFGCALALIGSTYRFVVFEAALAVVAVYILTKSLSEYYSITVSDRRFVRFLKILFEKKRLVFCAALLILAFVLNSASTQINTSTPELKYYLQYNSVRSAVWDYKIPDYEDCKEEYDNIGIDENDIAMLRLQYVDDEGAFSYNTLKQIKSIKDNYNVKTRSVFDTLKNMVVYEAGCVFGLEDKGVASVAGALTLMFFLLIMKKRNYFIPVGMIVVTAAIYSFVWIKGRPALRGVYMAWLGMIVFLLYSVSASEMRDYVKRIYRKRKTVCKTVLILLCLIISVCGLYMSKAGNVTSGNYTSDENDYALLDYMNEHKDSKFEIARNSGFNYNPNSDIYHVTRRDPYQNFLFMKGTYYKSPYFIEVYKDFGTDNYYSNLLNDNVYSVNSHDKSGAEIMRKYLQKYYSNGKTVTFETVDTVGDFEILKYRVE
ncbi:MAG: hypothetical protein IJT70_05440 [Clostridia bacterium]|nr:hypothetical protein [Clostridia bacterium]